MSWSFNAVGTPAKLIEALEAESVRLDRPGNEQCKLEFDAAKPALAALLRENFADEQRGTSPPVMLLEASGHGASESDGTAGSERRQTYRNCAVTLRPFSTRIV